MEFRAVSASGLSLERWVGRQGLKVRTGDIRMVLREMGSNEKSIGDGGWAFRAGTEDQTKPETGEV